MTTVPINNKLKSNERDELKLQGGNMNRKEIFVKPIICVILRLRVCLVMHDVRCPLSHIFRI